MRHLPSLFVILLSAATAILSVLFWQAQREHAELEAHNASLLSDVEQQVVFLTQRNELMRKELLMEIEEEILNQGKKDNAGLTDTLLAIARQADALLQASSLTQAEFTRWGKHLAAIYRGNCYGNWANAPSFDAPLPMSRPQQKLQLLRWEWGLLQLLSERFGNTGGCWGPKVNLVVVAQSPPVVPVGTAYEADLVIYRDKLAHYAQPIVYFETSMGTIANGPNFLPHLTIPTDGLLAPGEREREVTFTIAVRVVKPTGGYERLEKQGRFRLVRE